jgi:hypothetical protein
MSEGHQQPQPDAFPCQAGFRLVLKTGSDFRPGYWNRNLGHGEIFLGGSVHRDETQNPMNSKNGTKTTELSMFCKALCLRQLKNTKNICPLWGELGNV